MTLTATDLFCGAGGSSLGARAAGIELRMAANHWQTAIDVHQAHFPDAGHDIADISQADPRRYPRTDILLASPECTNHSQARGVSRKKQNPSLWDAPDPSAERSRATVVVPIRPLPRYVSNVEVAIIAVVFKLAELLDERPHVRPCKGCGRTNLRIDPTGSLCDDCCDGAA